MHLEKENGNTKWFKNDELKIKLVNRGTESDVFVTLKRYNLCFKLMMFDFVNHVKDDLLLDVSKSLCDSFRLRFGVGKLYTGFCK